MPAAKVAPRNPTGNGTAAAARPAPVARVGAAKPAARDEESRILWPLVWTITVLSVLAWGYYAHLERYITPQRGLGYWLGIIGGSLMVLLLLYSARKRAKWLAWMGGIPAWFEIHMVLGILGPILVLFHSTFRLGATNSNVALISMLLVAGSGVIGRYIYTRLHARIGSTADRLANMKSVGDRLRAQATSIRFLPGLLDAFDAIEQRLITPPKAPVARFLHAMTGSVRMAWARHLVRREIDQALERALREEKPVIARHARRICTVARRYAYQRLDHGRRVGEYKLYSQIFALWHVLHIPLFFMLLIAGIVHVIAVNIY